MHDGTSTLMASVLWRFQDQFAIIRCGSIDSGDLRARPYVMVAVSVRNYPTNSKTQVRGGSLVAVNGKFSRGRRKSSWFYLHPWRFSLYRVPLICCRVGIGEAELAV